MANMLKDEIQVIKAVSMEVDPNTVLIVTLQYHTEAKAEDASKVDRSKSFYRWGALVMDKEHIASEIQTRMLDKNRLERGKWPNDKIPYYLCIDNDSKNSTIANWLNLKLKKTVSWEIGQKILNGWKKKTASRPEGYVPNAKYRIDGYVCEDGFVVSLDNKEELMKHVNQSLIAPFLKTSKTDKTKTIA